MENFEKLLYQIQQCRLSFVVTHDDFNVKPKSWWNEHITSNEGSQIDLLATTYGTTYFRSYPHFAKLFYLYWLNVYRPTKFSYWQWCSSISSHKLPSPNNLFKVQPYHWISYQRLVWDYLCQVNWSTILCNKDVHNQVNILNSIILNVFTNCESNKVIAIDDKDPPWTSKIEWWNSIYKTFQNSSKNLAEYNTLQQANTEASDLIYEGKNDYHNALVKKLSN